MAIERWGLPSAIDLNGTASLTTEIALFGRQPVGEKQEEHLQHVGVCHNVGRHSNGDPDVEQINRVIDQNERRHLLVFALSEEGIFPGNYWHKRR